MCFACSARTDLLQALNYISINVEQSAKKVNKLCNGQQIGYKVLCIYIYVHKYAYIYIYIIMCVCVYRLKTMKPTALGVAVVAVVKPILYIDVQCAIYIYIHSCLTTFLKQSLVAVA